MAGTVTTTTADVLVIGGGLMGLASSLELARHGADVICIEADHFGGQQSTQNWGFVRKQGRGLAEVPLMLDSIKRWSTLGDDLDFDIQWMQGGNIAVFDTDAQEQGYRAWLESTSELSLDSAFVGQGQVSDVVHGWTRNIRGAMFSPSDGHSDPAAVVEGYLRACRAAGVRLVQGVEAVSLVTRGSAVVGARSVGETFLARHTVVANGSRARRLLDTIGLDFPQSFVAGTVALTTPVERFTDATVWGPGYAFRQRRDGRIVCSRGGGGVVRLTPDTIAQAPKFLGAFRRNWQRFAVRPSTRLLSDLPLAAKGLSGLRASDLPVVKVRSSEPPRAMKELQATVQAARSARVEHAWAGLIDSTPDGIPVIDGSPGPEGLTLATGFSGHGYGLVPTVGAVVRELVTAGSSQFDLSPFRLERFARKDYIAPDAVL